MKKLILTSLLLGGAILIQAQTVETVSMDAGYTNNKWYSLEDGTASSADANNWEIAFQIGGLADAGIRINEGKGVEIYAFGDINNWETVDTTGMDRTPLYNSAVSWSEGAIKQIQDPNNQFDYGWGTYDMASHMVEGHTMFILKLDNDTYKKMKIDKLSDQGSVYHFVIADLDGSNEMSRSVDKNDYTERVYVYYSILNDEFIDREAVNISAWDFLFTKYTDLSENPFEQGVFELHSVTGVLSNPKLEVAQVDGVADVATYTEWTAHAYSKEINTIGYDWKEFDMAAMAYVFVEDRVYFVKTEAGDVWKVVMTGFGGSSTGDFNFTKEKLSTLSLAENGTVKPEVLVYPNPATSNVSLILSNLNSSEVTVNITSMTGQVVYTNDLVGNNDFEVKNIQVGQLKAGIYMINVSTATQQLTQRLIIQ